MAIEIRKIDVNKLVAHFALYGYDPLGLPTLRAGVARCLRQKNLLPPGKRPKEDWCENPPLGRKETSQDWARVAWFVVHGWREPVKLDLGAPALEITPSIEDGRHRLAAAIYRQDPYIVAEVIGTDYLVEEMTYW